MRCVAVLLPGLLVGCMSLKTVPKKHKPEAKLDGSGSAYVAIPMHAMSFKGQAAGEGQKKTGEVLAKVFGKHLTVSTGGHPETVDHAFGSARKAKATYMVYARIEVWKDVPKIDTWWSSFADRLTMTLSVYDVQTKAVLDSVELQGKGDPWLGGEPQDILRKKLNGKYVKKLFK